MGKLCYQYITTNVMEPKALFECFATATQRCYNAASSSATLSSNAWLIILQTNQPNASPQFRTNFVYGCRNYASDLLNYV